MHLLPKNYHQQTSRESTGSVVFVIPLEVSVVNGLRDLTAVKSTGWWQVPALVSRPCMETEGGI